MFEKPPVVSIVPCSLGKWMAELNETDTINLQKWLDAREITHAELVRQIAAEAGRTFDKETMSAHRRGVCRCSKRP